MPCEGPVYLRHATADDAAGIAQVHVDGWQKAYKDLVPEQYLGCTNSRLREEFWRGELEVESPDRTPWVALIDDRVIGFAAGGITRDDDADPHTGEIYQLFVAPECWSQGIRSNLIKRVSRDLAEHGFDNAIFWILATLQAEAALGSLAAITVEQEHLILVGPVLDQADVDVLAMCGGYVLADIVGTDGQLTVATVDQDRQSHRGRSAMIHQCIEGGAHRASGEKHVIDEDDRRERGVEGPKCRVRYDRRRVRVDGAGEVVAIGGHIEG